MADAPNVGGNPDFEVRQLTRTRDLGSTLFDNRGRQYDRLSGASFLNVADTRTPGGVAQAPVPSAAGVPVRDTALKTRYTGSGRNWRRPSPTGLPGNAYYPKFTGKISTKVGQTIGRSLNTVAENAGYGDVPTAVTAMGAGGFAQQVGSSVTSTAGALRTGASGVRSRLASRRLDRKLGGPLYGPDKPTV